jgi:hypothetical protein
MRKRLTIIALALVVLMPSAAFADATLFIGKNSANDNSAVARGFAIGVSLVIIGFEFEYSGTSEDDVKLVPSLKTYSGNVFLQTPTSGVQLYVGTGAGFYRENLNNDDATDFALNTGGGAKIHLAGPLRARVDYRIFNLRGTPRDSTVQRLYAGINLAF